MEFGIFCATCSNYLLPPACYFNGTLTYSNTVKLELVSVKWENINYIREHDVLISGITTWQAVDNLAIGQKLQGTTYLDGLGRSLEAFKHDEREKIIVISGGSFTRILS